MNKKDLTWFQSNLIKLLEAYPEATLQPFVGIRGTQKVRVLTPTGDYLQIVRMDVIHRLVGMGYLVRANDGWIPTGKSRYLKRRTPK